MSVKALLAAPFALTLALPAAAAEPAARDASSNIAAACEGHDGWADPGPPAHVFGKVWHVGTCGITALLIETPAGLVLIDGGPADAAPLVAANIARLGFRMKDLHWILSTHEHEDHAGALAELQRLSGARLAASPWSARVFANGQPLHADPQFKVLKPMTPVKVARVLRDGEVIALGGTRFTPRLTPAHSPGSTSWSWRSCEGRDCRTITFADSLTTISADDYRFTDHPGKIATVRRGLAAAATLPCGILVTPHPGASDLFARLSGQQPLSTPGDCAAYASRASARFDKRLADEAAPK